MSVLVPILYCFYSHDSVIYLKKCYGNPSSIFLFAQDCFGYLRSVGVPHEF